MFHFHLKGFPNEGAIRESLTGMMSETQKLSVVLKQFESANYLQLYAIFATNNNFNATGYEVFEKIFLLVFFTVEPMTPPPTISRPSALYVAMLCFGIPLFIVGVLKGAKRVYAKIWAPAGFWRDPARQQVSLRCVL